MTAIERPQVYVNVVGGIAEVTVTRGDVEIIHQDWDNPNDQLEDFDRFDLEEMRERLTRVAMPGYRARLLKDIDERIAAHREMFPEQYED